jgi:hypothetical protein
VGLAILALRLIWVGLRKRFGRSILQIRSGRVWVGEEWWGGSSGRRSDPEATIVGIDVARLDPAREEIVITFTVGRALSAGTGLAPEFLRQFREELCERHQLRRAAAGPRPAPTVPAPVAAPRSPGPQVRPSRSPPAPAPRRKGETGIQFLTDPAPPEAAALGECQICSSPMTGDVVACQRCRTPHHRTCWEYNRRCSTYGCGGTRSAPVGPPRPSQEEILDIRGGGLGQLKRRFLRDWMVEVAEEQGLGNVRSREKKHRHCEASFQVDRLSCDFVGRKQGDRFEFVILAILPTFEARSAAESVSIPASLRRQVVSGGRLELRPASPIDRLALLRTFVTESVAILWEIARRSGATTSA